MTNLPFSVSRWVSTCVISVPVAPPNWITQVKVSEKEIPMQPLCKYKKSNKNPRRVYKMETAASRVCVKKSFRKMEINVIT